MEKVKENRNKVIAIVFMAITAIFILLAVMFSQNKPAAKAPAPVQQKVDYTQKLKDDSKVSNDYYKSKLKDMQNAGGNNQ